MKKILIIFVVILVGILGIFILKNQDNDNLNEDIMMAKSYTHIFSETIVNDETNLEKTIDIYTFDENDNCISIRTQFQFSDIETAQEQYKNWKNADLNVTVKEDNEKIITFNRTNISNNKSKQSVIEDIQKYSENSTENIYNWYIF